MRHTVYTDQIRSQSSGLVTIDEQVTIKKDTEILARSFKLDLVNQKMDFTWVVTGSPFHIYQNNEYDGIGLFIEQETAGNNLIRLDSGTQDWFFGIDNDDSDKFKISYNANLTTGESISITSTGDFALKNGVAINNIVDEDDMTSDSDVAVATQQSIKKYVDDNIGTTLGRLTDSTPVYAKILTGTITDPNYTLNIAHGVSNALTNERIVLVAANMVSGSSVKQVSSADVSYPESTYYDNTNVTITRGSNANDYDLNVFIAYI